jgi:chromosome segregation ATPase
MTAKFDLHGERMGAVAETAGALESRIAGSLAALEERLTASKATLAATDGEVERLTDASVRLLELIQASAKHSTSVLPEALAIAEDRLVRAGETLTRLIIDLDQGQARGEAVIETIEGGQERLTTLLQELEAAQDAISARADAHRSAFAGLQASLADIERSGERVEAKTRDELGAAITEVEDAVRAALSALDREGPTLIRSLADKLGDESGQAIERAMRPRVAEATGALEQAIAHASGAGREASLQLREQITAVSDLTASLENRVAQARERAEEQVDNDFSRRVALITDALNSNAIDIATALSSDIGDTAWSAYLRGDRGIFTRRAVSLLSANDVRAIQQLFERDDSFREHVSRYIHDFEALLRQVLSTRDGNALGVTLLSSDMGKLYVALAQGIERLRN